MIPVHNRYLQVNWCCHSTHSRILALDQTLLLPSLNCEQLIFPPDRVHILAFVIILLTGTWEALIDLYKTYNWPTSVIPSRWFNHKDYSIQCNALAMMRIRQCGQCLSLQQDTRFLQYLSHPLNLKGKLIQFLDIFFWAIFQTFIICLSNCFIV